MDALLPLPLSQVLRCFVSSAADPFFLHVLEVGEEEYAVLRQEQDIRVDFANFPGKLIGLLDKCIGEREKDLPRWVLGRGAGVREVGRRVSHMRPAWAGGGGRVDAQREGSTEQRCTSGGPHTAGIMAAVCCTRPCVIPSCPVCSFQAVLHTVAQPGGASSPYGAHHASTHLPHSPPPASPTPSTFRVVENNDFKQLPHISLAFRPGSDAAVKQFLAFRLGELRIDRDDLSAQLEHTQARTMHWHE